jgi:hypothetical protein
MATKTFIIDCPQCKAKVGAEEKGRAERTGFDNDAGEPYGQRLYVGSCPSCGTLLAGYAYQIDFGGWEGEDEDRWADPIRVYPKPPKTFASLRIPRTLSESLIEADRSMQASAHIAACVMFGRSLEALCRDHLKEDKTAEGRPSRRIMLGQGIRELRDRKILMIGFSIGAKTYKRFAISQPIPKKFRLRDKMQKTCKPSCTQ